MQQEHIVGGTAAKAAAAIVIAGVAVAAWAPVELPSPSRAPRMTAPGEATYTIANVAALTDGGAVMVRARDQQWELVRVDGAGHEVWTRPLRAGEAAPLDAVMTVDPDGSEGFVRYSRGAATFVLSFDAAGKPRWDVPVCKTVPSEATKWVWPGLIHVASTHVVVDCPLDDWKAISLDRETGRLLATHRSVGSGGAIFQRDFYDLRRGSKHDADAAWQSPAGGAWADDGCIADDVVVGTRFHGRMKHLFAFDGRGYLFEVPFRGRYLMRVHGCARYRDKLVVNYPSPLGESYLGIVNMSGTVERDLPTDDPLGVGPHGGAGPSPRFVPLLVKAQVRADAERVTALTMIDLERGEVAWTVVTDESFYDQTVFRVGETWYWVIDEHGQPRIVAFDGRTGELAGAVEVKARMLQVSAASVGDGVMWIAGRDGRTDAPRLATLDAKTLRPLRDEGLRVVDARARVAAVIATREPGCYDCRPRRARGRRP